VVDAQAAETLPLADAVTTCPSRRVVDGYTRGRFRHWHTDTNPAEVATPALRC
jgi:hypothetical protein